MFQGKNYIYIYIVKIFGTFGRSCFSQLAMRSTVQRYCACLKFHLLQQILQLINDHLLEAGAQTSDKAPCFLFKNGKMFYFQHLPNVGKCF